jgi:hypothetical protein
MASIRNPSQVRTLALQKRLGAPSPVTTKRHRALEHPSTYTIKSSIILIDTPEFCAAGRASPRLFFAAIALFPASGNGGTRVRGAKLHIEMRGGDRAVLIRPGSRLICAGIAALAIGFALGLRAVPSRVSVSETMQPKNFDNRASLGSQIPDSRELRAASLETGAGFEYATEEPDRRATSTRGRDSSAEDLTIDSTAASFEERFAGAADSPISRQTTGHLLLPSSDMEGHAGARPTVSQSTRGLPSAIVSKKQLQLADASAPEDSSSPPDADAHTAIYDIAAHRVYLPNGQGWRPIQAWARTSTILAM